MLKMRASRGRKIYILVSGGLVVCTVGVFLFMPEGRGLHFVD